MVTPSSQGSIAYYCKNWYQHTTRKHDLLNCCLAVRIFPAIARTFTKDTALSEHGRGAAWHVWIVAARHGHGMGNAWYVWISLLGTVSRVQSSKAIIQAKRRKNLYEDGYNSIRMSHLKWITQTNLSLHVSQRWKTGASTSLLYAFFSYFAVRT
jgi:hypothetical protein